MRAGFVKPGPKRPPTGDPAIPHPTKIATCCYCGTRAALVLDGRNAHALACRACGAPLRNLKMIPAARVAQHPARGPVDHRAQARVSVHKPMRAKKGKRRKGLFRYVLEEAFDVIEDIID